MRRVVKFIAVLAVLFIALPLLAGAVLGYARGWPASWRSANWQSARLLPAAATLPEAQVMIFAARTGRWKGIFAVHTWFVLKPQGATHWTRYEVVGWGSPIERDGQPADGYWYGNRPYVVYRNAGPAAQRLIPEIEAAIARYPWSAPGSYTIWPGPNSNSFVAWVVRAVPGFDAELPAVAIGKDWLGHGIGFARAASGTGFVVSLGGVFGFTLALEEGLEINIAGTGIGLDPADLAIKLPAFGTLSLKAL
jgi:hypothetical protein